MFSIIKGLSGLINGRLYVGVSRPNYDVAVLIEQLKAVNVGNDSFKYTDFELLFYTNNIDDHLVEILLLLWFAYEHTAFCFFVKEEIEFDIKRKSWYEITTSFKSYVLFRGDEEDVVWIGKSDELKFH